eukprot:345305-Amphidinium_carterae.1
MAVSSNLRLEATSGSTTKGPPYCTWQEVLSSKQSSPVVACAGRQRYFSVSVCYVLTVQTQMST